MAYLKKNLKYDSTWDSKKDADAVARKYRRLWLSASVQPSPTVPGWAVYIQDHGDHGIRKSIRWAAKEKFPNAKSITVTYRHGNAYVKINTQSVYRVIRSKASKTGFKFFKE